MSTLAADKTKDSKVKYKATSMIDFESLLIEGERKKPDMAIVTGNQTAVTYTDKMQEIIESEKVQKKKKQSILGKIGSFFRVGSASIAEEVKRIKQITLLEFIDNKCI